MGSGSDVVVLFSLAFDPGFQIFLSDAEQTIGAQRNAAVILANDD
jgi:hypothetical protein